MRLRPATADDLPALTEVQRAYDRGWFGEPEHDADEMREWLAMAEDACVIEDEGRIVAGAIKHRTGSDPLIGPDAERPAVDRLLLDWLARAGAPATEALDRDESLRAALTEAGWRHDYSSFDLYRTVGAEWTPSAPTWPSGVTVRAMADGEEGALHEMIYRDAAWADVPGHHFRDRDEWHQLFLAGRPESERPVLAHRGDHLFGAVLLRVFSDGVGWIVQLAVARAERGQGLGRALLLEGLDRLAALGAGKLGLAVIAGNRAALGLYLDVGLQIEREWQTFVPGR
jgi:ribosomal protein S18 acetylase RimI-like enzyme